MLCHRWCGSYRMSRRLAWILAQDVSCGTWSLVSSVMERQSSSPHTGRHCNCPVCLSVCHSSARDMMCIHCVQKKTTHSRSLSYLHEWCVDLNKNCSEYTWGRVDSNNVEIKYSMRLMCGYDVTFVWLNLECVYSKRCASSPGYPFCEYLLVLNCGRIVCYLLEFKTMNKCKQLFLHRLPELTSLTARSVAPLLPSGTLWTLISLLCAATV